MRAFHHCGNFPHNYGDAPEPMPELIAEQIAHTRDLPGFVEPSTIGDWGVTYESHHFYVHFTRSTAAIEAAAKVEALESIAQRCEEEERELERARRVRRMQGLD